jgi:biopolymer transport protein ExbD
MKPIFGVCLLALALTSNVAAQTPAAPVLQPGISVQLPTSNRAVAMPEADQQNVTVVTVTDRGDLYVGAQPITVGELSGLTASTVFVKADARTSYQDLLTALSALKGHRLVLLTEPNVHSATGTITPPYGISVVAP